MGNLLSCSHCGSTLKWDQQALNVVYDNSASLEMDSAPASPQAPDEEENPGEVSPVQNPSAEEEVHKSSPSAADSSPSLEEGEKTPFEKEESSSASGEGDPGGTEISSSLGEQEAAGEDSQDPEEASSPGGGGSTIPSPPGAEEQTSEEQSSPPQERASSLEEENKYPSEEGRDREGSIITPPPMKGDPEGLKDSEVSEQEGEEVLVSSGDQGFEDVAEFANSPDSPEKGFLLYDLQIQGIDSQDLEKELLSVFEDPQLNWDGREVLSGVKSGILEIKKLNPVKMFCLISALCDLPFRLSWRQYTVLDVTSSKEEERLSDPGSEDSLAGPPGAEEAEDPA